ncbi:MAG: hypothetical protein J5I93_08185, partial [Pirellulaceae bacterium]|nr:hypothetical protein [Pirellulaceae bacterium]
MRCRAEWDLRLAKLAGVLLLGLWVTSSPAQGSDEEFLAGLRARRLFQLAERFCTERLAGERLDKRSRAELTVELIRVRAERAVHASP